MQFNRFAPDALDLGLERQLGFLPYARELGALLCLGQCSSTLDLLGDLPFCLLTHSAELRRQRLLCFGLRRRPRAQHLRVSERLCLSLNLGQFCGPLLISLPAQLGQLSL